MPRIKKKRVSIRIDMTPLVDVAFLLLTFFMLTTQFKPPEEVEITFPSSHSEIKLPESNTMLVYLGKDAKLFLGFDSAIMMEKMFGQAYKLRQASEVKLENLGDLLIKARISNPKLRTIVKADAATDYGIVSDVMDILQKVQITRFSMVTNFEVDKKS
ncbi:MAG: biopolymer transporter ExbD [Ignavibacteriales bacterium]|nr:biopolymer transporter ExbD [Ignavibacteriales bacterium]